MFLLNTKWLDIVNYNNKVGCMLYFVNDYSEGAHSRIMEALSRTNLEQTVGYGMDEHCANASKLICKRIGQEDADVHFLMAGTQTNTIALASFLRPYEAIIATSTAHIAVHETGAIEATGHKVIEMKSDAGLLRTDQIELAVKKHTDEHMVLPKLVYISNATEMGTIYKKADLLAIKEMCDKYGLYLYMDGARLANALTCDENDLTIEEIAEITDAFYIGGTKNGMLIGEALVITNPELKKNVRFTIKQRGGLLAKGRLLGIEYEEMFKDNLYFDISLHTNDMAKKLSKGLVEYGYELVAKPQTNLVFVKLSPEIHEKLCKEVEYEIEPPSADGTIVARFVTSWATRESDVDKFLKILEELKK